MKWLELDTREREALVDVTETVSSAIREMGWRNGVVLVHNPHTTAGLTINEGADPDVREDILSVLARLVPFRGAYRHAEGNSDAHAKASLLGASLTVPLNEGKLVLGTWQALYFGEFDGPRRRKLLLTFLPGE